MAREKILVAYASKHGATAQIAERIGGVLIGHGRQVDVMPARLVEQTDEYVAVVLGIAVYMGRWQREGVRFLHSQEHALSNRPFWLFTSGPSGEGNPVELVQGRTVPPSHQEVLDRIHPRDIAIFHGALTMKDLSGFERWIIRRVKAQTGDFRDWDAIEAWAGTISASLAEVS